MPNGLFYISTWIESKELINANKSKVHEKISTMNMFWSKIGCWYKLSCKITYKINIHVKIIWKYSLMSLKAFIWLDIWMVPNRFHFVITQNRYINLITGFLFYMKFAYDKEGEVKNYALLSRNSRSWYWKYSRVTENNFNNTYL